MLQLTGITGLAIHMATVAQGGTLTNPMILGMGTLSGAACLAMGTLYYFEQRYVGASWPSFTSPSRRDSA